MGTIRLGDRPPLTLAPNVTVAQAARALTERNVGAAAIMDGGRLTGVVSERDILKKVVAAGRDAEKTSVREIMSSPAVTVSVKTRVSEAANLMRERHIRHLPVLDESGTLVAMLALRYLLYDMMDDMQRNVADLVGYIMTDGPGG